MKRRDFITLSGAGLAYSGLNVFQFVGCSGQKNIRWEKASDSRLFHQIHCEGNPLVSSEDIGLLNVTCKLSFNNAVYKQTTSLNPDKSTETLRGVKMDLRHTLLRTHLGTDEDLLKGTLTIRNESQETATIFVSFTTAAQPSDNTKDQSIYIPISATGLNKDKRLRELGSAEFLEECEQAVGNNDFVCHYLEPMASNPDVRKTKALLLAPVVSIENPSSLKKIALFTPSDQPYQFSTCKDEKMNVGWMAERNVVIPPGKAMDLNCYLLCYKGEADMAWDVFHRVAHYNEFEPAAWMRDVKVHYYDFLSSSEGQYGLRGDGYEADIPFFKEFRVGLATQHGYYPYLGDFMSPTRASWLAMQGDLQGPATMSIQKMKDRIKATKKTGARAGIYIHTVLFDEASPLFTSLEDAILIDETGQKKKYSWHGPDTLKQNWWMSFASKDWTNHLLKQAEYIMEILNPDAIVVDETFVCLGYENHQDRRGPLSEHSIKFFKALRKLVHSYGDDKVVLTSDCGGSNMVMWADGDAGDHSYSVLLGNPLYRKQPIRYKAALGQKPWLPCSWHFLKMWNEQMDLARKIGTAVGVSNGWIEFNGLHGLDDGVKSKLLRDINSL